MRKREVYSPHYNKKMEIEEKYYGVLVMVLIDEEGNVYGIWYTEGSKHEKEAFEERYKKSYWFRQLVDKYEVIGDKAYKGLERVKISRDKGKKRKRKRQIVETCIGGIKGFYYSRWRKGITLLAYLYGFALGFSLFRDFFLLISHSKY